MDAHSCLTGCKILSNSLDGMEDDLLWDDDKDDSDDNDPSSNYLPSDSDDAGEDKDST